MIWTTGSTGQVTYVSSEWTTFTGQEASEALGSGWLDMLHDADREGARETLVRACYENASFTMQYRVRRRDGSFARVVSGASPSILPIDGTFIGFLGAVIQISEATRDLAARRTIGKLSLPPPVSSTMPLTALDIIADYVLLARATADRAGEKELFACLDLAVTMIHKRLGGNQSKH